MAMPVTPFHFGPGTLLKAIVPRSVSLVAFVVSQVAIDVESGYHLLRDDWPVHREVHSLLVAALVGLLAGAAVGAVGRRLQVSANASIQAEVQWRPALAGGLAGGLSHPLLDSVMHADVHPFWPLSSANPFLAVMDLPRLHLLCLASGVAGTAMLVIRATTGKGQPTSR